MRQLSLSLSLIFHLPVRLTPARVAHYPLSVATFSPFEGSQRQLGMCPERAEYVIRGRFVIFSSLSPFGGSGAYRINDSPHFPFSVILPPTAYALRPIASSSFFRLETPFLTFLALLYYSMNQQLIYPSYTNRPRFV